MLLDFEGDMSNFEMNMDRIDFGSDFADYFANYHLGNYVDFDGNLIMIYKKGNSPGLDPWFP